MQHKAALTACVYRLFVCKITFFRALTQPLGQARARATIGPTRYPIVDRVSCIQTGSERGFILYC